MTAFDDKWQKTLDANPALKADGARITLTTEQLKALLRKFYNAGEETVAPIATGLGNVLEKFAEFAERKHP